MCVDLRQLILSKLPRADLARPAGTCREFREAFRSRVAEERAALIALAKEAYGEARVNVTVTAIQRAMRGLEPFPSITRKEAPGEYCVVISAAGEPRRATWEVQDKFWRTDGRLARFCTAFTLMVAVADQEGQGSRLGSPRWQHRVQIGVSRDVSNGVDVDVELWEDECASIGVLLAIFTEDPEALLPCMPICVTLHLGLDNSPEDAAGRKAAQELVEPLRMLAHVCTYKCWQGKCKSQKWEMLAHPRSALKTLKLRW